MSKLGNVYYAAHEKGKNEVAEVQVDKESNIVVRYENQTYANAMDWLAKAFHNSGKSIKYDMPQNLTLPNTPRPRFYIPPSRTCPYDRYM